MAKLELREGFDIPDNAQLKSAEILIRYQLESDNKDYYKMLDDWMVVIKPRVVVVDEFKEVNRNGQ